MKDEGRERWSEVKDEGRGKVKDEGRGGVR